MSAFIETLQVVQNIQAAGSPDEICQELLRVTSRYGLTNLIAGTMPLPGLKPAVARSHILFAGWPQPWMERYVERNYVYSDPIIQQVQSDATPFRWTDACPHPDRITEAKTVMNEASEHGLAVGFAVPLITLEGQVATVSFGAERMDLPQKAAGSLSLIATFAIDRAFELHHRNRRGTPVALTEREMDCVRWTAEGKTEWEISTILNISHRTVEHHLASARSKFDVLNKTHLIAEAIRAGIIR
jgi:LuxR family quorum sensing-dependent transcriptional regulator